MFVLFSCALFLASQCRSARRPTTNHIRLTTGQTGHRTGARNPPFARADIALLKSALACDSACQYLDDANASSTGTGVAVLDRPFTCSKVWLRMLSACPAQQWPPPTTVPPSLHGAFTMDGAMAEDSLYRQQRYSGGEALQNDWDRLDLDARIAAPDVRTATDGVFTYTLKTSVYVDNVLAQYASAIKGGAGLVWGSEKPWAEIVLARRGAAHVLTVEYGHIAATHPTIAATTPQLFAAFMAQSPRQFDFVFTFSSLEHSGLGRYGDTLNPYGDLEAVAQSWCALKPGGLLFLGVPSVDAQSSQDRLVWNAHRFYGPKRLAQMFAGFEHLQSHGQGSVSQESVIHVLRKPAL